MSAFVVEITAENFEDSVMEASRNTLVVIDFWAPWCAPCRALKPILEKLAVAYAGRFILAKLNTDELPDIARRFGVRGIPDVKAVIDGKVVAEFTGAIPESKVRAFLDKLLPGEGETLRRAAQAAVQEGDFEKAESLLRDAIAKEPGLSTAKLDLTQLLVARQAYSEAELVLLGIPESTREGSEVAAKLLAQITVWKNGQSLPPIADLLAAIEGQPDDLTLHLKLAERYMADGQFAAALDALIVVIERDRRDLREAARKSMLQVFGLAAEQPELVSQYRRRLASALN